MAGNSGGEGEAGEFVSGGMSVVVLSAEVLKSRKLLVLCYNSGFCWTYHVRRCHVSLVTISRVIS